jgi:glycolate oxidase
MLAVVTEVTVKLLPGRRRRRWCWPRSTTSINAATRWPNVIAAGIIPAGMEMMDQLGHRRVEPFVNAGYDLDAAAILLCESDGTPEEVAEEIARMSSGHARQRRARACACRATRPSACASGPGARPPSRPWAASRPTTTAWTAPFRASAWPRCCADRRDGRKYGLRCANVFHAGDGNLHPLILFDANDPGPDAARRAVRRGILKLCIEVGGTITGEHGVGIEKIDSMCVQFQPPNCSLLRA